MSALPFFYLITEDNHTATLAATEPEWGRPLIGVPSAGRFEMTPWQILQHVLVFRLARHRFRTSNAMAATACVIASPIERGNGGSQCSSTNLALASRFTRLGEQLCPGKPIVVIDGPDADGTKDALCSTLWSPGACERGLADRLVRASGNAPGLQSEVATRLKRGLCRRLPPTPYLAHAVRPLEMNRSHPSSSLILHFLTDRCRHDNVHSLLAFCCQQRSAAAATAAASAGAPSLSSLPSSAALSAARPLRIAYAAASWGHVDAERHGFVAWRKALRNACKALHQANASRCRSRLLPSPPCLLLLAFFLVNGFHLRCFSFHAFPILLSIMLNPCHAAASGYGSP